jgi:D-alanyl-D-alanine carboxypeptidase
MPNIADRAGATGRRRRAGSRAAPAFLALIAGASLAILLFIGGTAALVRSAANRAELPACRVADEPAEHAAITDWDRTLLDTAWTLPRSYAPDDPVPVAEAGLDGGGSVRALVILDLAALTRAAADDGVELSVISAYRSYDAQVRTFSSLERAYGRAYALQSAARPGHSEHQLGTALDLEGGGGWLADHAWEHGFVVSYPAGRSPAFTCYKPEPWHVRYVGPERAAAIHASGLSPREWLWTHADDDPGSN